ncbi:hypothetical protein PGH46_00110 [Legionella pneumophila]|nr:hypothetical protein PGH46_00110 [Legionella pneumophila]
MNYSPLGAGALAGSTLPLDREWVAESLGFAGIIPNTLMQSVTEILSLSYAVLLQ